MRSDPALAALVAILLTAGVAHASDAVAFTPWEARLISRNELLLSLRESDPALVRRILDLVRERAGGLDAAPGPGGGPHPERLEPGSRTAEGSAEWLALLREARARKAGQAGSSGDTRSAEGSVELMGMLREARRAKQEQRGRD